MSTRYLQTILVAMVCLGVVKSPLAQEVQFRRGTTRAQDVTSQLIRCELDAERMIRQQNQVIDTSKHKLVRQQDRVLTVLDLREGVPQKVSIAFPTSKTSIQPENEGATELTQPVEGNIYFAELQAGKLIITDEHGATPADEELKIVSHTLETLGKPNPLAVFLDDKRIRVGQKITVPQEIANELLGQTGSTGKVDQLTLTLSALTSVEGQACGVFDASLRTDDQQLGATSLLMRGTLVIEINSCRTRSMSLRGPVATSELHGPKEGRFIVSTNGLLRVAIKSSFSSSAH